MPLPRIFLLASLLIPVCSAVAQVDCSKLPETDCFYSAACSLDCQTAPAKGRNRCSPYKCRPKEPECERAIPQAVLNKDECESRKGCEYVPANCYCKPGLECFCGGGNPASCKKKAWSPER